MTNILRDLKVRKIAKISIFPAGFVPSDREMVSRLLCIAEKIPMDPLEKVRSSKTFGKAENRILAATRKVPDSCLKPTVHSKSVKIFIPVDQD